MVPAAVTANHSRPLAKWGFTFRTFGPVWGKTTKDGRPNLGMGYWLRAGAEVSLLATKGSQPPAALRGEFSLPRAGLPALPIRRAYDPFDSKNFVTSAGVKKPITNIPVKRPNKQTFFRICPADDRGTSCEVFDIIDPKNEREEYVVRRNAQQTGRQFRS